MVCDRTDYLRKLLDWKDEKVIKVITGLRRGGKSTLLMQFRQKLLTSGISPEQIITINFDDLQLERYREYHNLYQYVLNRLVPNRMNYIILDEVQLVPDFQKAVDSLYLRENVDLYLAGSNACLLSGELATLLSGRYVEINMLPLSFKEYCALRNSEEKEHLFADYLTYGALPYLAAMDDPRGQADPYLEGSYNTVLVKALELAQQRGDPDPNRRKVSDLNLLGDIARYLARSIGTPVSIKSITDSIMSDGRGISPNTVRDYLDALIEPYLFYPAERYDIRKKQLLKTNGKLYIADLGLRRYLIPRQDNRDLGASIENTVYLELRRRYGEVYIGIVGRTEVGFVARRGDFLHYFRTIESLVVIVSNGVDKPHP